MLIWGHKQISDIPKYKQKVIIEKCWCKIKEAR